uniref:Anti-sigma F factor n=1 Tax=Candidatus Methanogaster sp. ANME-2c ERB4 TaxID=2759911 RepID=A0A7G9YA26_9EURY|nr:anti-sigma F factor [Methanosarcinales archaeon ANME-2c ERB4]QNO44172.1 anti-sigma F factor [Methanosarcinales archaeon ANME-2c ERB4]QNO44860.1 anti-sigma F factor [Methanosarcinales archaeon ANME-2c ERB4]QNO46571.1 anti-sigma F factor [Methanosarcinales archaeon ANME-2c ERB4]
MTESGNDVITVKVDKEPCIAKAQIASKLLAKSIGFSDVGSCCVATSVSELANNLVFHTRKGGTITMITMKQNGRAGIEIIAEDEGPGIPDLKQAMQNGFSTNRGLGGGLPGVKRLMDEFYITSEVGTGTRIVTRKWQQCR